MQENLVQAISFSWTDPANNNLEMNLDRAG